MKRSKSVSLCCEYMFFTLLSTEYVSYCLLSETNLPLTAALVVQNDCQSHGLILWIYYLYFIESLLCRLPSLGHFSISSSHIASTFTSAHSSFYLPTPLQLHLHLHLSFSLFVLAYVTLIVLLAYPKRTFPLSHSPSTYTPRLPPLPESSCSAKRRHGRR